jgi:NADH dehydrogenase/NADH:ubiquinone oxidoreductase subunit G
VAVLYYHFNDGQNQIARDKARVHVAKIRALEKAREPDWESIHEEYDKVAGELPADEKPLVRHQIRLAKAKARLEMLDIVGAIEDLTGLLQEAAQIHGDDAKLTRAVREMLGKAHYYATYLLKTNGASEDEWRPYAERTRQIFRYLAEHQEPAALAQYERRVEAEFEKTLQRRTP